MEKSQSKEDTRERSALHCSLRRLEVPGVESPHILGIGLLRVVPREDQFPILALLLLRVVAPLPSEEHLLLLSRRVVRI